MPGLTGGRFCLVLPGSHPRMQCPAGPRCPRGSAMDDAPARACRATASRASNRIFLKNCSHLTSTGAVQFEYPISQIPPPFPSEQLRIERDVASSRVAALT